MGNREAPFRGAKPFLTETGRVLLTLAAKISIEVGQTEDTAWAGRIAAQSDDLIAFDNIGGSPWIGAHAIGQSEPQRVLAGCERITALAGRALLRA